MARNVKEQKDAKYTSQTEMTRPCLIRNGDRTKQQRNPAKYRANFRAEAVLTLSDEQIPVGSP